MEALDRAPHVGIKMKNTRQVILITGATLLTVSTVGPMALSLLTGGPDRILAAGRVWLQEALGDPLTALYSLLEVGLFLLFSLALVGYTIKLWGQAVRRGAARPAPAARRSGKYLFWGQGTVRGRGGAPHRRGRVRRRRPLSVGGIPAPRIDAPVAEPLVPQSIHPGTVTFEKKPT